MRRQGQGLNLERTSQGDGEGTRGERARLVHKERREEARRDEHEEERETGMRAAQRRAANGVCASRCGSSSLYHRGARTAWTHGPSAKGPCTTRSRLAGWGFARVWGWFPRRRPEGEDAGSVGGQAARKVGQELADDTRGRGGSLRKAHRRNGSLGINADLHWGARMGRSKAVGRTGLIVPVRIFRSSVRALCSAGAGR